jgi:hypothetical protein
MLLSSKKNSIKALGANKNTTHKTLSGIFLWYGNNLIKEALKAKYSIDFYPPF